MTDTKNLLPCPMCGCNSITIKNEQPTDNSGGYFIECPDCGTSTSLRYACGDDPMPLLAEQWNRRTSTQYLHQIAEPATVQAAPSEVMGALRALHDSVELAIQRGALSERALEIIIMQPATDVLMRAAAPQAVQAAVPMFWVRLLRDGLYEGPVHNNSVGGKMLRDEKPGEWHPLYLHAAPAYPAEGVHAAVIAGAIFDFAGYLTTLPHEKALHCSEAHEASPMVEAITEWCKRRGLRTDGARVETWRAALAAQAKQGGV